MFQKLHYWLAAMVLACVLAACGSSHASSVPSPDSSSYTPPTTTVVTTSTTTPSVSNPDVTEVVTSQSGDKVEITEWIGETLTPDQLPSDVQSAMIGCGPHTLERALFVPVRAQLKALSSLPIKATVRFNYSSEPGVIRSGSGLACTYTGGGMVDFNNVAPGTTSSLEYWMMAPDAVTPAMPGGDPQALSALDGGAATVYLPGDTTPAFKIWGPRVFMCGDANFPTAQVRLAGPRPNCPSADTEAQAITGK